MGVSRGETPLGDLPGMGGKGGRRREKGLQSYQTMQLVENGNIGDERRQFGMMNEAPAHRDDGIPGRFRLGRGFLGENQVVLPDLVDVARRVGQACMAGPGRSTREVKTD